MIECLHCLVDDTTTTSLPSASNMSQCGESDDTVITVPPTKKSKGLSKVLGHCLGNSQCNALTTRQRVKQELDQYLSHPQLDIEESPLDWWKIEAVRYPNVAKLAQKYLCLCATNVPSERVFSCGGNIVTDRRTCLKPEQVDSLVFLALNMKN